MTKIKFDIEIDTNDIESKGFHHVLRALHDLIPGPTVPNNQTDIPFEQKNTSNGISQEDLSKKKTRKRRTKAEIEADKAIEEAGKTISEVAKSINDLKTTEDNESPPEHTLDSVRSFLAKKIKSSDENKDKCIDKLREYGAKNISTLPEDNYGDFMAFLNTL